jgi:hypothetical protein
VPRWRLSGIGNAFTAFARRYRLNTGLVEVLDSVLPVAQVDKHWQADRLNIWGGFGQQTAAGINLEGVGLVAANSEVLVHKIEAWIDGGFGSGTAHLFTPLQTYNFAAIGPAIFLPWLQMPYDSKSTPARLPAAFIGAGANAALQTLIVNGTPFTTVGPTYKLTREFATSHRAPEVLWSAQDPPLRLHPQQELVVQATDFNQFPAGTALNVNFYFSEREPQGSVG